MNKVILIGRLTKDPEITVQNKNQLSVCKFNLAINRMKDKDGNDMGTDYPSCVCFGKTAENLQRFCKKGTQICVEGSLQTGSYEKEGQKHYTTDVIVSRVEFLAKAEDKNVKPAEDDVPSGFSKLSKEEIDDLPF